MGESLWDVYSAKENCFKFEIRQNRCQSFSEYTSHNAPPIVNILRHLHTNKKAYSMEAHTDPFELHKRLRVAFTVP